MARVLTGLERVATGDPDAVSSVRGRRVGLLAHPASVDTRFRHAREVLVEAGARVVALFGPEHGYGGEAQDMVGVATESGAARGVPVYSLYGPNEEDLWPRPEWLSGLDAVIVDLQDVGARYYTFAWTAAQMLAVASRQGVETVVLDRPNPLGGQVVEGAPQQPGYLSFVGRYAVPVRHAMTIGEMLSLVRALEGLDEAALRVVPMRGWERSMGWEATGLPWVPPSPNMPTPDTARVYPGGCLLEGTLMSEGRGTTRPFEIWGAPGLDGGTLARACAVEGAVLRPLRFRPMFQKHAGVDCGGVQVHVTDANAFRPYAAYLRLIAEARRLMGDAFRWRTESYEFVADPPAIDLLTGGPDYRRAVDANEDLDGLLADDAAAAGRFAQDRAAHLLYRP